MLDIPDLMHRLSEIRPVFHSEDDFKFELAWLIQAHHADARIRIERPVKMDHGNRPKVDVWVDIGGAIDVIELKYQTVALRANANGEEFDLANKGAEDNLGYDFIRDLVRVEHLASNVPNCTGHAILLANEAIWKPSPRVGEYNKDAFRIHDGRELSGTLSWRDPRRAKKRAAAHSLKGTYSTVWKDYSMVQDNYGRFRYLWLRTDSSGWPLGS